jgi:hypothetical protein
MLLRCRRPTLRLTAMASSGGTHLWIRARLPNGAGPGIITLPFGTRTTLLLVHGLPRRLSSF